ncbi:TetR/AcrR family transcriptional regulator [Neptunicella marina]|uniref:TetR/AcrR family transcriptional regulator n=1 Tax=Neptunicella marina TaxID=2125989 RepID=A0A8J6IV16_9ALTE|nr:TetR/AcrR family transcriptional regulator [Neptunicella marina]MBC3766365.1 TetR/AcrR family transcriptional regulator [Neptunicella marina]
MKLSEQKRLDILTAAELLFYQHGVEQTSMDLVAKQANVSKRTVYNHFATKEQLFHAILLRLRDQLDDAETIAFDPSLDIRGQLVSIARQEAALLTSDKFLRIARVAFLHMLQQPDLAKQLSDNKVGCMAYLETFLTEAVAAGKLAISDIELAAKQFVYQLKSFIFYPHLYGFEVLDKQQEQQVIEETVEMFLCRYLPT